MNTVSPAYIGHSSTLNKRGKALCVLALSETQQQQGLVIGTVAQYPHELVQQITVFFHFVKLALVG